MQKILVIKHGALGDWILATGTFKAIREKHPQAYIIFLTQTSFVSLANQTTWFDQIYEDNRESIFKTVSLLWKIKKCHFDIVYDIQCSSRTEWYRKLLKTKKMIWHARSPDSEENAGGLPTPHIFKRMSLRARAAGLSNYPFPTINWLKGDISHFHLPKQYIILITGCSPKRLEKRWTAEGYIELINHFAKKNIHSVLIGTKDDTAIIDSIMEKSASQSATNLMAQCSLGMIASLCRDAIAVIGSDTGPMHIAGLCAPCLVLFSNVSDPEKNKPCGDEVHTLQVDCLKDLTSTVVINTIENILSKT